MSGPRPKPRSFGSFSSWVKFLFLMVFDNQDGVIAGEKSPAAVDPGDESAPFTLSCIEWPFAAGRSPP